MMDDTCNHTRLTSIVTSSIELCTGIIGIKITDSYLVSQHTPIYLYDGSFCVLKLFYCWIGGVVVLSWIILDQTIFWWEWKLKWCQKIFAMQTRCRFRNTDITFPSNTAFVWFNALTMRSVNINSYLDGHDCPRGPALFKVRFCFNRTSCLSVTFL